MAPHEHKSENIIWQEGHIKRTSRELRNNHRGAIIWLTGLSGSGPAFVYVMIEALGDAGVRMGLPRTIASALAAQTVRGAAEMVLATGEHPAILKDRVASPGGTTIAGLQALENGGIRSTLIAAVEAATKRSIELAAEAEKGKKV